MFDDLHLSPTQIELLTRLVEAALNVPADQHKSFVFFRPVGSSGLLKHPGLPGGQLEVDPVDLEILLDQQLLIVAYASTHVTEYGIHPRGYRYL